MADNVAITAGSGTTIAADELTDGTLGSVKVQFVKLMDGTLDSANKGLIDIAGNLHVSQANANIKTGQAVVATPGTAVQLGTNSLSNGITIKAGIGNNAIGLTIGGSGVNDTVDGTGNGHILYPGDTVFLRVSNSNDIYINSQTTGDFVSFAGN